MCAFKVVLGQALHQVDELLPSSGLPFDDIAAAVLLVFFGIKTLQVRAALWQWLRQFCIACELRHMPCKPGQQY